MFPVHVLSIARAIWRVVVLVYILWISLPLTIQAQTTTGKDFWLGFMYNDASPHHPVELTIYLSSGAITQGTISIPNAKWSQPFKVDPTKGTKIVVPTDLAMARGSETIQPRAIHIESDDTVACFALNYSAQTSDASVILPTKVLGKEYRVMAYTPTNYPSELMVVPTLDSTEVEITPSAKTLSGHKPDIPFTVILSRGEVYQVQSDGDLTGSRIIASKGVAVFGGSACASVPAKQDFSNHLFDEMYPLSAWGKQLITVPLKTRKGDTFRILASEDSTLILIDSEKHWLNAGRFYETILSTPTLIRGSKPIAVAQFSNSEMWDNTEDADPFMTMLSPNEQMQTRVMFNAFESKVINAYYLNILARSSGKRSILLDGKSIYRDLKTVQSDTNYCYAQLKITAGDHIIIADSGFIGYVYGYGPAESYGYSAGASIKAIQHFALIRGVVHDKKTGKPLSALIVYETLPSGKEAGVVHSNPETGEYTAILPTGSHYGIHANDSGYYAVSDNLDVLDTTDDFHLTKSLELVPIEVGQVVRLNNVFFAVNQSSLRPESFPELDRVVKLMKENKQIAIAISGHTDNVGADDKNMALSEDRAKSVAQYIVQAGIDSARVTSKGFGKTVPIASNDTEDGRQQNRRVEFAIVK